MCSGFPVSLRNVFYIMRFFKKSHFYFPLITLSFINDQLNIYIYIYIYIERERERERIDIIYDYEKELLGINWANPFE